MLLLLTDVDGVYSNWGTDAAQLMPAIDALAAEELELAAGSMGPKVLAAGRFAAATGGRAAIGSLGDATALVAGTTGTQVQALARAF